LQLHDTLVGRATAWIQQRRIKNDFRPGTHLPAERIGDILGLVVQQTDDVAGTAREMSRVSRASHSLRAEAGRALTASPEVSKYMSAMSLRHCPTVPNLLLNLAQQPHIHIDTPSFPHLLDLLRGLKRATAHDLRNTDSLLLNYFQPLDSADPNGLFIPPLPLKLVDAFANVHANGRADLTTGVVMPRLRPGHVRPFLDAIGRIAEADGSKLGSVEVDLVGGRGWFGSGQGVRVLARAVKTRDNRLQTIDLGRIFVRADALQELVDAAGGEHAKLKRLRAQRNEGISAQSLNRLLTGVHNKMVDLCVRLGDLDAASATLLTNALGHEHCKLQMADLDFSATEAGFEQALGVGLRQALQRPQEQLRRLRLAGLPNARPVVEELASALQAQVGMPPPRQFDTLVIDSTRVRLQGIGTHGQNGTLSAAIAHPQCPLRRLTLTRCQMEDHQIVSLVRAAVQPGSRLESIDLRNNAILTPEQSLEIRTLQGLRPGLQIVGGFTW
jgi:hypothetical protein